MCPPGQEVFTTADALRLSRARPARRPPPLRFPSLDDPFTWARVLYKWNDGII